jgi:hypothetical protein
MRALNLVVGDGWTAILEKVLSQAKKSPLGNGQGVASNG